jgi:hypothetical protein
MLAVEGLAPQLTAVTNRRRGCRLTPLDKPFFAVRRAEYIEQEIPTTLGRRLPRPALDVPQWLSPANTSTSMEIARDSTEYATGVLSIRFNSWGYPRAAGANCNHRVSG